MNDTIHERVVFRLIMMPCCGHLLCWVNPRFPSFCPSCGKMNLQYKVREAVIMHDSNAELILNGR